MLAQIPESQLDAIIELAEARQSRVRAFYWLETVMRTEGQRNALLALEEAFNNEMCLTADVIAGLTASGIRKKQAKRIAFEDRSPALPATMPTALA
ncbi:MAG: hypothetical protein H0U59_00910 [Gemmatimonadaceae bacterium]|nr:hypothetical protein [Gemmatimonadaceae bacterium]